MKLIHFIHTSIVVMEEIVIDSESGILVIYLLLAGMLKLRYHLVKSKLVNYKCCVWIENNLSLSPALAFINGLFTMAT